MSDHLFDDLGVSLPRYSINGSPRSHLMEPLLGAMIAIRAAQEQLAQCWPHGRDYSDAGWAAASKQHTRRRAALAAMHGELMELAVHIDQTWPVDKLSTLNRAPEDAPPEASPAFRALQKRWAHKDINDFEFVSLAQKMDCEPAAELLIKMRNDIDAMRATDA